MKHSRPVCTAVSLMYSQMGPWEGSNLCKRSLFPPQTRWSIASRREDFLRKVDLGVVLTKGKMCPLESRGQVVQSRSHGDRSHW